MYVALLLFLLIFGGVLLAKGIRQSNGRNTVAGSLIVVSTIFIFALMSFWGEMLWFLSVGYSGRFWTVVLAKLGAALAGGLLGWLMAHLLTKPIPKHVSAVR